MSNGKIGDTIIYERKVGEKTFALKGEVTELYNAEVTLNHLMASIENSINSSENV